MAMFHFAATGGWFVRVSWSAMPPTRPVYEDQYETMYSSGSSLPERPERKADRTAWYALAGALVCWAILTAFFVFREGPGRVVVTSPHPAMSSVPGRVMMGSGAFNANELNEQAWDVVSSTRATESDIALALKMAERANEIAAGQDFNILDTLARAHFRAKNFDLALKFQRDAIAALRASGAEPIDEYAEFTVRLKEYEAAIPATAKDRTSS